MLFFIFFFWFLHFFFRIDFTFRLFLKAKQDKNNIWRANAPCTSKPSDKQVEINSETLNARRGVIFCELYFITKLKNGMTEAYWSINVKCIVLSAAKLNWLKDSQILDRPPNIIQNMLDEAKSESDIDTFFVSNAKEEMYSEDEGLVPSPSKKSKKNKHDNNIIKTTKLLKKAKFA